MYEYITQIIDFKNQPKLEGYNLFFSLLHKFLNVSKPPMVLNLSDSVYLDSFKFDIQGKNNLFLDDKDTPVDPKSYDSEGMLIEEETDLLSNIIKEMNEVLGEGLPDHLKRPLENLTQKIENHEELETTLGNNTESNSRDWLEKLYLDINKENFRNDLEGYKFLKNENIKDIIIQGFIDSRKGNNSRI